MDEKRADETEKIPLEKTVQNQQKGILHDQDITEKILNNEMCKAKAEKKFRTGQTWYDVLYRWRQLTFVFVLYIQLIPLQMKREAKSGRQCFLFHSYSPSDFILHYTLPVYS